MPKKTSLNSTLFRYGAAAYVAVSLINGINSEDKITTEELAISAGVFVFGMLLKCLYKPYHRIGQKYHFKILSV